MACRLLPMSELQNRFTELVSEYTILSALQSRCALAFGDGIFARAGIQYVKNVKGGNQRMVG